MKSLDVSDAELRILQLLWDGGRLTARQLTQKLYPGETTSDVATVQKLVQRLELKRLVGRDRSAFVHSMFALVGREEFAAQRLGETFAKYARGSAKPLLAHLVESDQLSPEDLDEIRRLLDKHRKKRR